MVGLQLRVALGYRISLNILYLSFSVALLLSSLSIHVVH